jgi:hypothetical protein
VTSAHRGFDALVGNPPWVSYAGKAAQPIADPRRAWYDHAYEAFAGYKNLQGLFLERMANVGHPSTRVGLVLPSSMAELDGYGPSRAAFDRAAVCDPELPDLGEDSFRGVSQPSMVLHGTFRLTRLRKGSRDAWPIERPDVDDEATRILARLVAPPFPPETFGERGLQTLRGDTDHFTEAPDAQHTIPLRVGSDINAFRLGAPSIWADPEHFGSRLRPPAEWQRVDVVIRQTARVPIATRSDGLGFRNTLLAAFASPTFSAGTLLAWLNSRVVCWSHYYRNRDARLGMPQVKIGHLRSLPAPPASVRGELHRIGEALAARNTGLTADEQMALDDLAVAAFGLSPAERARITFDAEKW